VTNPTFGDEVGSWRLNHLSRILGGWTAAVNGMMLEVLEWVLGNQIWETLDSERDIEIEHVV